MNKGHTARAPFPLSGTPAAFLSRNILAGLGLELEGGGQPVERKLFQAYPGGPGLHLVGLMDRQL